ncbi:MAG: insulinase family protein [Deltaproteobacteria bacterium]|nr:MAG: insulinase family protein [Deltaproteobacteria bacterium]
MKNDNLDLRFIRKFENILEYRLWNDMQCLFIPDHIQPTITVNLTVLVGSKEEEPGKTGVAHILEHVLFRGSKHYPDPKKYLEQQGIYFNASTSYDYTNFFAVLPNDENLLQVYLKFELDRITNSLIRKSDVNIEKSIIKEEMEIYDNDIELVLQEYIMAAAYKWHNYRNSSVGNIEDVMNITVQDLKRFYQKHYKPENMILIISGNIRIKKILKLVVESFGKILKSKRERERERLTSLELPQEGSKIVTLQREGIKPFFGIAYHVPPGFHKDFIALRILGEMMSLEPGGILYENFVRKGHVANLNCYMPRTIDPGLFYIMMQPNMLQNTYKSIERVINLLENDITKLINFDVFMQAKNCILRKYHKTMSDTQKLTFKLTEYVALGDYRSYFWTQRKIKEITLDNISQSAKHYLIDSNRTVCIITPKVPIRKVEVPRYNDSAYFTDNDSAYNADEINKMCVKGKKNLIKESFEYSFYYIELKIRKIHSKKENCVFLYKDNKGEVKFSLVLSYGSAISMRNKIKEMFLFSKMIPKGVARCNYQGMQSVLDKMQSTIEVDDDIGRIVINVVCKNFFFKEMATLLYEIIYESIIDNAEYDWVKTWEMSKVIDMLSDIKYLGVVELDRLQNSYPLTSIFYNEDLLEQIRNIEIVTIDKLRLFYNELNQLKKMSCAFLGQYQEKDINVLKSIFNKESCSNTFESIEKPFIQHVPDFKMLSVIESQISIVFLGFNFELNDALIEYPMLKLISYIYGEGMNSRLWIELREKRGLSYDLLSWVDLKKNFGDGIFGVYVITSPGQEQEVISALQNILVDLLKNDINEEEFIMAKNNFANYVHGIISSDSNILETISENMDLNQGFQYCVDVVNLINEIQIEDVQLAFERCFDLLNICIVLVGKVN